MALVNPNIAMSFRQPEFTPRNALAEYAQMQQIQGGQQAQELNKLQIQEYQREREEEEGTRNFLRGRRLTDPETQEGLAQYGKTGLAYAKLIRDAKNVQLQIDDRKFGLQDKKLKFAWNAVGSASTPQAAIDELTKGVNDGVFNMQSVTPEIEQLRSMTPAEYQQYRVQKIIGILDAKDKLGFMLPNVIRQDIGGEVLSIQNNPALPDYGQPIADAAIDKTITLGEAKRLDRAADPAFQQIMATARARGTKTGQDDVVAAAKVQEVISRAEEGTRLIDELIGKRDSKTGQLLKGEKTHPGFHNAVGATWLPGARFIDGTDAASFMSRFNQIKGASFLEAYEFLKGGGAITEKEGDKGTDAINRMSIATSEDEFIRAAMDLQDVVRSGVAKAQARAAQAGGRGGAGGAPAAAGGGGAPAAAGGVDTSNPLLK